MSEGLGATKILAAERAKLEFNATTPSTRRNDDEPSFVLGPPFKPNVVIAGFSVIVERLATWTETAGNTP